MYISQQVNISWQKKKPTQYLITTTQMFWLKYIYHLSFTSVTQI